MHCCCAAAACPAPRQCCAARTLSIPFPNPTPHPSPSSPCPTRSEARLNKVKLVKADVELLMSEFDLPKSVAERQLRESGGEVAAAVAALVGAAPAR